MNRVYENDAVLADGAEVLFRQVRPDWVRDGRPSSQNFKPMPKDDDKLSLDRSSMITAEEAFRLHAHGRGMSSAGSWPLTVLVCNSARLTCFGDPTTCPPDKVDDPAHAVADFSSLKTNGMRDAAASLLARYAHDRGCAYAPPTVAPAALKSTNG